MTFRSDRYSASASRATLLLPTARGRSVQSELVQRRSGLAKEPSERVMGTRATKRTSAEGGD